MFANCLGGGGTEEMHDAIFECIFYINLYL